MNFETYLEQYGTLTYTTVGVSMKPLLRRQRDLFTLVKKGPERCKKYDVVLYIRPPHQYVIHRIVEVRENGYVILGDNCPCKEYDITDDDIIAVMTGFTRNGKDYSVDHPGYRLYCRIWVAIAPLRMPLVRLRQWLGRIQRRLTGEKK